MPRLLVLVYDGITLNAETITFPAQNRADLYDGSALNAETVTVSARSRVHLYDGIRESVDINI